MSNTKKPVYKKLAGTRDECFEVLRTEIGIKTNCAPFALKLTEAMKGINPGTEAEKINAANTLLSGLQTLYMGGILPEDYDKIDFIKRGEQITVSARVEAFLRAAARKGYRIICDIIAVPKEDNSTTFYEEEFWQGERLYKLCDKRNNIDREITAARLKDKYFAKFICRLDITDISKGTRLCMTTAEMTIDELLAIASASEQGIYKSEWETYVNRYGKEKKRKVLTGELNDNKNAFWIKWTSEMVRKTVLRRALKWVKEVLPELQDQILAFEQEDNVPEEAPPPTVIPAEPIIEVPIKSSNVNVDDLTPEQVEECKEFYEMCKENPKLLRNKFLEISDDLKNGASPQSIVNTDYTALWVLKHHSFSKWQEIRGYFGEEG